MKRLIMIVMVVLVGFFAAGICLAQETELKVFDFFPATDITQSEKNSNISEYNISSNDNSQEKNKSLGMMFVSRTNWNYNAQNIPTVFETIEISKFTYNCDKKVTGFFLFGVWGRLDQLSDLDKINKEVTYLYKTGGFFIGPGYRIEGANKNFVTAPIYIKSQLFNQSWTFEGLFEPCIGLNTLGKLEVRNVAFLPNNNSDFKIGFGGQFQIGPDGKGYHIIRLLVRTGKNPVFDFGIGEMNPFSNDKATPQIYVRLLYMK